MCCFVRTGWNAILTTRTLALLTHNNRFRPRPASSRAGPSLVLKSWPSPSCPASTALPPTTTAEGPGATATPTGAGLGAKKWARIFGDPVAVSCAGAPCQSTTTVGFLLEQTKNPPPPLTLTNLKHLQIAFYPPQSNRWKEAGLDRMAVVPETVELASKAASEGCVEVRFRAKKCGLFPLFFADLSPLFPRSALIFSSFD